MANKNPNQNGLKKIRTTKEARKKGANGGKKSGEVRRQKKSMKEMLNYLLDKEVTNQKGETASTLEAISISLVKQAMSGNTKAFVVIRDTIGEMPTQKVELDSSEVVKQGLNRINEYFGSNQK